MWQGGVMTQVHVASDTQTTQRAGVPWPVLEAGA